MLQVNEKVLLYITNTILNSGEQLDVENLIPTSSPIADIPIIRRTARTLRQVGVCSVALPRGSDSPKEVTLPAAELMQWTPGKRAQLTDERQAFEWLSEGWVVKEIRFKRDGKTVERVHYRMGYRLFAYMQSQADAVRMEQERKLDDYRSEARQIVDKWCHYALCNEERKEVYNPLLERVFLSSHWTVEELMQTTELPTSWGMPKKMKYLQFVLAFLSIASRQDMFDWKEIGAQYIGGIGGSKAFDRDREDFIDRLEVWSEQPLAALGMVSPGRITPLYFAGQLSGQWSCYKPGPVHALTDVSIAMDQYRTNATTLWLVENRGILTRIAAERDFVESLGTLVVCVDGHVRSAHRRFIQQVIQNSSITQVLLWSDYDEDGLLISGEMAAVVAGHNLTVKWIAHDHRVIQSWSGYYDYMKELLQRDKLEQEQVLGGVKEWRQWIEL